MVDRDSAERNNLNAALAITVFDHCENGAERWEVLNDNNKYATYVDRLATNIETFYEKRTELEDNLIKHLPWNIGLDFDEKSEAVGGDKADIINVMFVEI